MSKIRNVKIINNVNDQHKTKVKYQIKRNEV